LEYEQASSLNWILVANGQTERDSELPPSELKRDLLIRHQYELGNEPYRDDQKQAVTKGRGEQRLQA
jgi:hypothetical protein